MGTGREVDGAFLPAVNADFRGNLLLPNGVGRQRVDIPAGCWWSPALDPTSPHIIVGGETVWVDQTPSPNGLVVAHPNRLGSAENLPRLAELARHHRVDAWVLVDPILTHYVEISPPLRHGLGLAGAANRQAPLELWGQRSLQAADALQRRLKQVPGLRWPVRRQAGRAVTCLSPLPGSEVVARLGEAGIAAEAPSGWWDGIVTFTVGWWHTRGQLEGLAMAMAAILSGQQPSQIEADVRGVVPADLPHRRLNNMMSHLRGD